MKKLALLTFVVVLGSVLPVAAASVDYPKLPKAVQEEVGLLWFTKAIWEGQQLKAIETVPQYLEFKDNIDSFDALYEAATLNSDQKAFVGYLVYSNRCAMYMRLAEIDLEWLLERDEISAEMDRALERYKWAEGAMPEGIK